MLLNYEKDRLVGCTIFIKTTLYLESRHRDQIFYEYCYAARSTFAKLKVIVTCTYSNFIAQGLKTSSDQLTYMPKTISMII